MTSPKPMDLFLTVNGLRIHLVDWGGEGPPVLLLHATGFHARLWDPIARRLSHGFHVLAPDARGHGDSEKPDGDYGWSVFITDILGLLEAMDVQGVLGVGHSMGATTLAGAAAAAPGLFQRIVLLDMVLFPREFRDLPEAHNPMVVAARKRRQHWSSREEIFDRYRDRPPFDTWREECLRLYIEHGTDLAADGSVTLKCPGEIEARVYAGGTSFYAWEQLDHVSAPALLVRGEKSYTFPESTAQRALGHLRHGRLLAIPGTTHFIPMEEPDPVASAVEAFASEGTPGT